ncbi:MAG: lysoplasmalogenase [Anaerolineales bacterium]|nr:lysoplasmalogenase [Anaerolineales bacterium]
MSPITYLWIPLLIAVLDWLSIILRRRLIGYLTKPGVMVALLSWVWLTSSFKGPILLIGFALLFSLLGDVFLMLPKIRFFAGIISFSIAHFIYIIALNLTFPPINHSAIILFFLIAIITIQISRRVTFSLKVNDEHPLIPFIWIYSLLISVMLFSALLTLIRPEWEKAPALILSAGAFLFFLSDSLLAINKFVSPIASGQLKIRATYHLGQIAIVLGFLYNFSP